MSNLKIFCLLLSLFFPCCYALEAATPNNSTEYIDSVVPFFNVTRDGKVIFSDFTKTIDHPVPATVKPDPQTGVYTKDAFVDLASNLTARLFVPKIVNEWEKLPILLYFHGGAFVIGSASWSKDDAYLKKVASKAHALVVSVEYRLWPKSSIPAPYEDGYSALQWVASQKKGTTTSVAKYGDFSRIFIGGDSSGGNIAHNVAMRMKDQPLPDNLKITGLFLAMPYFLGSKPVGSETIQSLENSTFTKLWRYVSNVEIDHPWMNPFSEGAPSLSNMNCKKMMVYGATKDTNFLSRSRWYAQEAKTHGFNGAIEYYEGNGDHVFHVMDGDANPETSILIQRLASFVNTN